MRTSIQFASFRDDFSDSVAALERSDNVASRPATQFEGGLRFLLLVAMFALTGPGSLGAAEFRAGAAQVDITPRVGTPRGGAYATISSVGILDPIHAKAIVVEQDGQTAAFVALDVAYTPRAVVVAARKLVAEQTGIHVHNTGSGC